MKDYTFSHVAHVALVALYPYPKYFAHLLRAKHATAPRQPHPKATKQLFLNNVQNYLKN
jgi:hypothetical protein